MHGFTTCFFLLRGARAEASHCKAICQELCIRMPSVREEEEEGGGEGEQEQEAEASCGGGSGSGPQLVVRDCCCSSYTTTGLGTPEEREGEGEAEGADVPAEVRNRLLVIERPVQYSEATCNFMPALHGMARYLLAERARAETGEESSCVCRHCCQMMTKEERKAAGEHRCGQLACPLLHAAQAALRTRVAGFVSHS